jgi:flagellar hook-associated protein 1 FlgK
MNRREFLSRSGIGLATGVGLISAAAAAELDEPMNFDPAAGLEVSASLGTYTSAAVGWLENLRQDAAYGNEAKGALSTRTATALSNATGVNVDEEMSLLLDLEHSYEASARMIRVVDEMLAALLAATG